MAYWIFRCNTDRFDLDRKLADQNKSGSWKVNRHKDQIHSGDLAFIWQSRKPGKFSGIRAICSIVSEPKNMPVLPAGHPDLPFAGGTADSRAECQVWITYTDSSVRLAEGAVKNALPNLSTLVRPWDGTNFDVKPEESAAILKMISGKR